MQANEFTHRECEMCTRNHEVVVVTVNDMDLTVCQHCAADLKKQM